MALGDEGNKGKFKLLCKVKNFDKAEQERAEAMQAVSQWENIMKYL